jgi:RND family efflux transporter MFP subunit
MKTTLLLLTLALALHLPQPATAAPAVEEPSVQVETADLKRQAMVETLTVYGTVMPVTSATENMSFPRPVQITRLLVAPGQVVKRGEALLELSTEAGAAAAYSQATSEEDYARGELKRMEDLAAQRLATQSQVAAARKALQDAQTNLAAQQNLGTGVNRQTVTATFDALVTSISVQQGDRIQPGTPVMQLAKSDALRALLGVEPEDANRVHPGMAIRLASVFDSASVVDTKVNKVFGAINPQTRLVDVESKLQGPVAGFLPGMQVRGEIDLGGQEEWVAPRSAVLRDERGAYLFQVRDGRARRIDVSTGVENGGLIAVSGPLDRDLKVVVLGNYELNDGMAVREAGK